MSLIPGNVSQKDWLEEPFSVVSPPLADSQPSSAATPRVPPSSLSQALAEGRWDIPLFSRDVLGITLHPGQIRFADAVIKRSANGLSARYLTLALSSGNRAGKTLVLAIIVLHSTFYKTGVAVPNYEDEASVLAHQARRYVWYHFGISIDVAGLLFEEATAILRGIHVAQKAGCPLVLDMGKAVMQVSGNKNLPWLQWHEYLGGGRIEFKTSGEKAIGQLGRDMDGISFDECGFEPNLDFIVNEVLHMRRLSTGGQLILISTPSQGFNQFYDQWERGDPESPVRLDDCMSLRMSTRDNVGYGISQDMLDRMIAQMPPHLIPQNIDGGFIQGDQAFFDPKAVDHMFDPALPYSQQPEWDGHYIQGVDPALSHDATWSIALRVNPLDNTCTGVQVRRLEGKQTVQRVVDLITNTHLSFNGDTVGHDRQSRVSGGVLITGKCETGVDTTGFGGKVLQDMLRQIIGARSVEFGGTKANKTKLLTDLKALIEQGRFRLPRQGVWLDLRSQLLAYKLADRKLATDGVMALAVAARILHRHFAIAEARREGASFGFFGRAMGDNKGVPGGIEHYKRTRNVVSDNEFLGGRAPTSTMEGFGLGARPEPEWLNENWGED